MNTFYEHHKGSINFAYRCFDRILLNGLIQPFQQPERVIGFFRGKEFRSLLCEPQSQCCGPESDQSDGDFGGPRPRSSSQRLQHVVQSAGDRSGQLCPGRAEFTS